MGKTKFIKNTSIILTVLGVAFVSIEFLKKSIHIYDDTITVKEYNQLESNKTNVFKSSKNNFEENRTLDLKYQSVASQIKAFIKKQKEKHKTIGSDKAAITINEINLTKLEIKPIENNITIKKKVKIVKKSSNGLPKLAIIMDDVGFYEEIEKIKNIPFPITPSIFPPNEHYPNTPEIAKKFKHHMVHFPMEAYKYKNIREKAINISDKVEIIEKKVQLMQQNFPDAVAINNHTGSKYTCNFDAMEQFFSVLNRYDIDFIDSRTASGTKCQEAGKLLHKKVLQRDVFLDNRADVVYIKNQLKEAVRIAKKNGTAIAICHPREMTFEALMSCGSILKGVEVVYINELL
jgi:polysaccharide deacetylase 2 family uncharacterized protein YibQ